MVVSIAIRDGRGRVRSTHSFDSSKETAIEVLRHVNRPIYPDIIFTRNISAGPNPVLFPAGKINGRHGKSSATVFQENFYYWKFSSRKIISTMNISCGT